MPWYLAWRRNGPRLLRGCTFRRRIGTPEVSLTLFRVEGEAVFRLLVSVRAFPRLSQAHFRALVEAVGEPAEVGRVAGEAEGGAEQVRLRNVKFSLPDSRSLPIWKFVSQSLIIFTERLCFWRLKLLWPRRGQANFHYLA